MLQMGRLQGWALQKMSSEKCWLWNKRFPLIAAFITWSTDHDKTSAVNKVQDHFKEIATDVTGDKWQRTRIEYELHVTTFYFSLCPRIIYSSHRVKHSLPKRLKPIWGTCLYWNTIIVMHLYEIIDIRIFECSKRKRSAQPYFYELWSGQ